MDSISRAGDHVGDGLVGHGGDLGAALALRQVSEDCWRSVSADTNFGGEVFGGQYLGLSVKAAMLSAPDRTPHAMTGFFLRGARAARPVDYRVEVTRDGRAFAHRRVTATQDGAEVFRAEVSFHDWEDGQPDHATAAPPVPAAESLPSLRETVTARAAELDEVTVRRIVNRDTFDTYFTEGDAGLGAPGVQPRTSAWVRPTTPLPADNPVANYAAFAYLTDACANFASRTTHANNLYDGQLMSVSLNHMIWFHRVMSGFDRLLYVVDSPFAGGGLGYNRGTIFNADGTMAASVVQEALIRRRNSGD